MSISDKSLWEDKWIKQLQTITRDQIPMKIFTESFMDTSRSTTHDYHTKNFWKVQKNYRKIKVEKVIEDPQEDKIKPQLFDPKELDIDD